MKLISQVAIFEAVEVGESEVFTVVMRCAALATINCLGRRWCGL